MNLIISGKMCSGKSTVAKHLETYYQYEKHSFAYRLKYLVQDLYGVYMTNDEKPRKALQLFGQAVRDIGKACYGKEDVWAMYLKGHIAHYGHYPVVIDDARYPDEIEAFLDYTWIEVETLETLRYKRFLTTYKRQPMPEEWGHKSEAGIDEDKFMIVPYVIHNDGTLDELYAEVDALMSNLGVLSVP